VPELELTRRRLYLVQECPLFGISVLKNGLQLGVGGGV
jgi:hypothetical protein